MDKPSSRRDAVAPGALLTVHADLRVGEATGDTCRMTGVVAWSAEQIERFHASVVTVNYDEQGRAVMSHKSRSASPHVIDILQSPRFARSLDLLSGLCDLVPAARTRKEMKMRIADDRAEILEFLAQGRIKTACFRTFGCWALCVWDVISAPASALVTLLKSTKTPG